MDSIFSAFDLTKCPYQQQAKITVLCLSLYPKLSHIIFIEFDMVLFPKLWQNMYIFLMYYTLILSWYHWKRYMYVYINNSISHKRRNDSDTLIRGIQSSPCQKKNKIGLVKNSIVWVLDWENPIPPPPWTWYDHARFNWLKINIK